MPNRPRGRGDGLLARILVPMVLLAGVAACSSSTDPAVKPTRATIEVTGTVPVPLRLVVSRDFVEFVDPTTLERRQSLNQADTLSLTTLPYVQEIELNDSGDLFVELANPSETPATARLRVELDSGQDPYDREATMSEGGALRYVFSFFSPTL